MTFSEQLASYIPRMQHNENNYQTGFATVVSDCMKLFHSLPVSHQIDIRTAKFLENFMCSENYICTLFKNKADSYLKKFSVRGNTMLLQF